MEFYLNQLLVDGKYPKEDYFQDLKASWDLQEVGKRKDKETYYARKALENNDDYFAIHLQSGTGNNYSPEVVDANDQILHENPKKQNEIEISADLFVFYMKAEKELLYYPKNKIQFVSDVMFLPGKRITVKPFITDFDEFINTIKKVDSIRLFSADPNTLFQEEQELTDAIDNLFGYGKRPQFKLDLDFKGVGIDSALALGLRKLKLDFDCHALDKLMIVGQDSEGFNTVFNASTFSKKIEIEVVRSEFNRYKYSDVIQKVKEAYGI